MPVKNKKKIIKKKVPFFRTTTSELFVLHERLVVMTRMPLFTVFPGINPALKKCAICGEAANFVVTEITPLDAAYADVWAYCGRCKRKE
jgi:transcription elongation factor Elf1